MAMLYCSVLFKNAPNMAKDLVLDDHGKRSNIRHKGAAVAPKQPKQAIPSTPRMTRGQTSQVSHTTIVF